MNIQQLSPHSARLVRIRISILLRDVDSSPRRKLPNGIDKGQVFMITNEGNCIAPFSAAETMKALG